MIIFLRNDNASEHRRRTLDDHQTVLLFLYFKTNILNINDEVTILIVYKYMVVQELKNKSVN